MQTPQKIHEPEVLQPKKCLASKFSTPKNYDHISILIYSIKQTLRPKKICDRSLDPKNTESVNFQTPPPPPYKLQVPPGPTSKHFETSKIILSQPFSITSKIIIIYTLYACLVHVSLRFCSVGMNTSKSTLAFICSIGKMDWFG